MVRHSQESQLAAWLGQTTLPYLEQSWTLEPPQIIFYLSVFDQLARLARSTLPVHRSSEEKRDLGQVDFTRKWKVDLGVE